jgi:GrpB-like predicted nucleotidyltransferase (UPF0157 family)
MRGRVKCNGEKTLAKRLQIVPYDAGWPLNFELERGRISGVLESIARRIDHHGSTAVPGLEAKPVIDIQVSVENLQPLRAYAEPLAGLGYIHVPHADDVFCPFFHRPRDWPHTHHVHVVRFGGKEEERTLAFRDYLREHPDVAREYAALKRQLAAQAEAFGPESRESYANAKSAFIERTVRMALSAGYPFISQGTKE